MRSCTRVLAVFVGLSVLACAACGGGAPRSQAADMLAITQPTPDPTLDAVVRDLPRSLAGVAPTATPLPASPKPAVKQAPTAAANVATAKPTEKPTTPNPTATVPKPTATVPKLTATVPMPTATVPKPTAVPSKPATVASPAPRR